MSKQKYGFVYLWRDRKHNRYYVGSHWGTEDDGYVCSSRWMNKSYARRPNDFKRRILCIVLTNRADLLEREQYYLNMIKSEEVKIRYYNLMLSTLNPWYNDKNKLKTIGEKISAAKLGKNTGKRDPSVGAKISASKKGVIFTEEHKQKLREAKVGSKHTEERKLAMSIKTKQQWADGTRIPRPSKSKAPSRKPGERMKELWADPIWAANQRQKLKDAKPINKNITTEE